MRGEKISQSMDSDRASQIAKAYAGLRDRAFWGISALLFAASASLTILWCTSMSAKGEMPMPGGWAMSMAWMRMPGQSWVGAAVSFVGMRTVMMVAMMLPCLLPMLRRYREAVDGTGKARRGWLTALVGAGYFFIWTVFGMAAYALGVALSTFEMRHLALARAVPTAAGVIVLIAGFFQLTRFKAYHLACCQKKFESVRKMPADAATAWHHGLRFGLDCSYCCAGLMATLLMLGVMNVGAMAVVAVLINVERLAPATLRVVEAIGVVVIGLGLFLIARSAGIA